MSKTHLVQMEALDPGTCPCHRSPGPGRPPTEAPQLERTESSAHTLMLHLQTQDELVCALCFHATY